MELTWLWDVHMRNLFVFRNMQFFFFIGNFSLCLFHRLGVVPSCAGEANWPFFFFFYGCTHGLLLAMQACCHLSHSAIFALLIFWIGSPVFPRVDLDCDLPIYASWVAGITGACCHTQLFIGWDGGGLTNFLPWLALNYNSMDFCLPSNWDYRNKPLHPA
jgi:hypothetical protein